MAKHRKTDSEPKKDNRARTVAAVALLAGTAAVAAPAFASSLVTAAPATSHLPGSASDPGSAPATKDEAFVGLFGWSSIFDASWDPHWGNARNRHLQRA